jgi:hypothetical protein
LWHLARRLPLDLRPISANGCDFLSHDPPNSFVR